MKNKVDSFSSRLCKAISLRGLTQSDLCNMTGIPKSAMSQYCSGSFEPKQIRTDKIASALRVNVAWLMGFDVPMDINADLSKKDIPDGFIPMPKMRKIPLVGNIACGVPILAEENIEGEVDLPDDIHADYALRCKGDSMIGCGIRDGDVVYIRKTGEVPRNGQIVAVRIEDEATLKRFYLDGSDLRLVAENPSVPTLYYSGPQLELVSVEGIAVGYTHKIRE